MTARPDRRILLVDADAFFVAVARLVDPDGAGRAPLLIVGGRPGSRGVVCSASYEARRYGVRSAMPIARATKLCPAALCVPVPRAACASKSRDIASVLAEFAPIIEAASVDEWYLDLAGTEALYRHEALATTAARIRTAVHAATGLTVSIGGGPSKLIAKLAVERAKPRGEAGGTGTFVVPPGSEPAFMGSVVLADIPGVGPKFRLRLEHHGLRTVADLRARDADTLARQLGARNAAWLIGRARGIDDAPVEPRTQAKRLSREETFDVDLVTTAALERALHRLACRVAADLRADGLAARTIAVKLRDSDFTTRQQTRTVEDGIESDRAIWTVARALLTRLRAARSVPARLLGIAVSSFQPAARGGQLSFLADDAPAIETDRDRAVSRMVDRVRAAVGPDAIGLGLTRRTPAPRHG